MTVTIGQPAPAFSLHDTDRKEVSLKDLQGKNVLLLFFPLAFTSVCTKELCNVRDNIAMYSTSSATVLGISVDSPMTLAKFRDEQQLNFTLLSDFNKEACTAYGCLYDNFIGWMHGVSKRSAFIIDKQGIIKYAEVLENAGDLPSFDSINAILKALN